MNTLGNITSSLLSLVFGYITIEKKLTICNLVCNKWRNTRAIYTEFMFAYKYTNEQFIVVVNNIVLSTIRVCKLHQQDETTLRFVLTLKSLQGLHFRHSKLINDDHMQLLSLHNLQELKLYNTESFTNKCLDYITMLSNLTKLTITGTHIDNIQQLHKLRNLYYLCVSNIREGFESISKLKKLRVLSLNRCNITDMHRICTLQQLQVLELSHCNVTDEDLVDIDKLVNLLYLKIMESGITDYTVHNICYLSNLIRLDLICCDDVTDGSLPSLVTLPNLKELILFCRRITERGIKFLNLLSLDTFVFDSLCNTTYIHMDIDDFINKYLTMK